MLMRLSVRNARRQSRDYFLFFFTLVCVVSLLYAFCALIFSESVKALPGLEVLPYMLLCATLLIILIMGWIVGSMMNDMLKKRSRELCIYLLTGVPARSVVRLVFLEHVLIGSVVLITGLPFGFLLSQLLEAVVARMFAMDYRLRFSLSWKAAGVTLLSFLLILLYAFRRNGRWLRRASLRELLDWNRRNEQMLLRSGSFCVPVFFLSLLSGLAGIFFLSIMPLGKGLDVLAGVMCLVLFLAGFFQSVPAFLALRLSVRPAWKYRRDRLLLLREFTARIRTMSADMGILAVLLTLSLSFLGAGASVYRIAEELTAQNVFDLLLLHPGEMGDFSHNEAVIHSRLSVQDSHAYALYTEEKTDFLAVRDNLVSGLSYMEHQYDACMRQSDYVRLRKMLGYEPADLEPDLCYIHCIPVLKAAFETALEQTPAPDCAGYPFAASGIFCEPFSQSDAYGNGMDYLLIVPDEAVGGMEVVYSLWAAVTSDAPDSLSLQETLSACDGVVLLRRNIGHSTPDGHVTSLVDEGADYLSGRWADGENRNVLYSMAICLFYLALVLEITGGAILAVRLLGDGEKRRSRGRILHRLGMPEERIRKTETRLLLYTFLFPAVPSLVISACFVSFSARRMAQSAFRFPVFANELWILQAFGTALLFFLFLYGVYYAAVSVAEHDGAALRSETKER
ncbi:MAG TPA: FtsX-like permease family protein [Candidatus Eisenbergiella merdavium]|uniref:FtsX-like permease family protein n=1 Tax=Candidatus Eisenbergiella merdavium TaxID=2838551 RepID=A0A9D2NJ52_9FIRM|nr:FtsX-like permease family protein [Candidatus Eisenbergiella merdavium]